MSLTLLFDLDGTLLDTDPLHFQAFVVLLARHRRPEIDFDLYKTRIMGFGHAAIFALLFPDRPADEHAALAAQKEQLFRDLVGHERIAPRAGLLELLDWADRRGARYGVVTNAPRDNAGLMLRAMGLDARLAEVVYGEELAHGKPHPLPYQTGLSRLAGHADRAIAFEDSLSGVRSASAAGLYTVGVRSSLTDETLRAAGAHHTIDDFADLGLRAELERRM
ncbi:MAG TPA: HAD-IA family hydrolase [Kofleriaceae bacterium]